MTFCFHISYISNISYISYFSGFGLIGGECITSHSAYGDLGSQEDEHAYSVRKTHVVFYMLVLDRSYYCFSCVLTFFFIFIAGYKVFEVLIDIKASRDNEASLDTFIERVQANTSSQTILVALLVPSSAGRGHSDGWFTADFAIAYHIYGDIGGEQTWLTCVDLAKEAQVGPYF